MLCDTHTTVQFRFGVLCRERDCSVQFVYGDRVEEIDVKHENLDALSAIGMGEPFSSWRGFSRIKLRI